MLRTANAVISTVNNANGRTDPAVNGGLVSGPKCSSADHDGNNDAGELAALNSSLGSGSLHGLDAHSDFRFHHTAAAVNDPTQLLRHNASGECFSHHRRRTSTA